MEIITISLNGKDLSDEEAKIIETNREEFKDGFGKLLNFFTRLRKVNEKVVNKYKLICESVQRYNDGKCVKCGGIYKIITKDHIRKCTACNMEIYDHELVPSLIWRIEDIIGEKLESL